MVLHQSGGGTAAAGTHREEAAGSIAGMNYPRTTNGVTRSRGRGPRQPSRTGLVTGVDDEDRRCEASPAFPDNGGGHIGEGGDLVGDCRMSAKPTATGTASTSPRNSAPGLGIRSHKIPGRSPLPSSCPCASPSSILALGSQPPEILPRRAPPTQHQTVPGTSTHRRPTLTPLASTRISIGRKSVPARGRRAPAIAHAAATLGVSDSPCGGNVRRRRRPSPPPSSILSRC